jgi:hypothetical protein
MMPTIPILATLSPRPTVLRIATPATMRATKVEMATLAIKTDR